MCFYEYCFKTQRIVIFLPVPQKELQIAHQIERDMVCTNYLMYLVKTELFILSYTFQVNRTNMNQ